MLEGVAGFWVSALGTAAFEPAFEGEDAVESEDAFEAGVGSADEEEDEERDELGRKTGGAGMVGN